jgi:hypothetical protein
VAKNPEHHGRMKHLGLHFYWLRDEVERGAISVLHVQTNAMPADILTNISTSESRRNDWHTWIDKVDTVGSSRGSVEL